VTHSHTPLGLAARKAVWIAAYHRSQALTLQLSAAEAELKAARSLVDAEAPPRPNFLAQVPNPEAPDGFALVEVPPNLLEAVEPVFGIDWHWWQERRSAWFRYKAEYQEIERRHHVPRLGKARDELLAACLDSGLELLTLPAFNWEGLILRLEMHRSMCTCDVQTVVDDILDDARAILAEERTTASRSAGGSPLR
jgi:hypothetical protein